MGHFDQRPAEKVSLGPMDLVKDDRGTTVNVTVVIDMEGLDERTHGPIASFQLGVPVRKDASLDEIRKH